jgi:hypothetical protein
MGACFKSVNLAKKVLQSGTQELKNKQYIRIIDDKQY